MQDKELEVQSGGVIAAMTSAEIEQQVRCARNYPRDISKAQRGLSSLITSSEDVAAGMLYSLPRGGKAIEGPSARFAEALALAYGNVRVAARVVYEDDHFITAQGVCHDLESNSAVSVEVRRRITDSQGKKYGDDMVTVTANAACSIARRNAILAGIPRAFWGELYDLSRRSAAAAPIKLAERRTKAFQFLASKGIGEARVLAALGVKNAAEVGHDQLLTLRGAVEACQSGEVEWDDAFPEIVTLNVQMRKQAGPVPASAPEAEARKRGRPRKTEQVAPPAPAPVINEESQEDREDDEPEEDDEQGQDFSGEVEIVDEREASPVQSQPAQRTRNMSVAFRGQTIKTAGITALTLLKIDAALRRMPDAPSVGEWSQGQVRDLYDLTNEEGLAYAQALTDLEK